MSKRLEFPIERSPGPQDYNPEEFRTKRSEPKFSIRMRSKSFQDLVRDKNQYTPAPNAYELKGSFNDAKGV